MAIPEELKGVLESTLDTLGGSVRFAGTRVPVQALLETLEAGHGLDYFFECWPEVTLEQAQAVIRWEQSRGREVFGNQADLRIQSGLDELNKGMFVEGTASELYNSAIKRLRQRLALRAHPEI